MKNLDPMNVYFLIIGACVIVFFICETVLRLNGTSLFN
jgi:hypothetical protein